MSPVSKRQKLWTLICLFITPLYQSFYQEHFGIQHFITLSDNFTIYARQGQSFCYHYRVQRTCGLPARLSSWLTLLALTYRLEKISTLVHMYRMCFHSFAAFASYTPLPNPGSCGGLNMAQFVNKSLSLPNWKMYSQKRHWFPFFDIAHNFWTTVQFVHDFWLQNLYVT